MSSLIDRLICFFKETEKCFPAEAILIPLKEHILGVEQWNWDYESAHDFQKTCVEFVRLNPQDRIYIFCNHPHVFTMGSGLQKKKGQVLSGLYEFTEDQVKMMNYPLHHIRRGGGLTFHHPGQWIFYPIVNLNQKDWGLSQHFDWLLNSVSSILKTEFSLESIEPKRDSAGIWNGPYKVASVGIGVSRFVTCHGLALNIFTDEAMFSQIKKLNPCGLNPSVYRAIDQFTQNHNQGEFDKITPNLMHRFHQKYIKQILC